MGLLARFQTSLERSTVRDILVNKKVDMSDQASREELLRLGAIPKKRKLPADMLPAVVDDDEEAEGEEDEEDYEMVDASGDGDKVAVARAPPLVDYADDDAEEVADLRAVFDEDIEDEPVSSALAALLHNARARAAGCRVDVERAGRARGHERRDQGTRRKHARRRRGLVRHQRPAQQDGTAAEGGLSAHARRARVSRTSSLCYLRTGGAACNLVSQHSLFFRRHIGKRRRMLVCICS